MHHRKTLGMMVAAAAVLLLASATASAQRFHGRGGGGFGYSRGFRGGFYGGRSFYRPGIYRSAFYRPYYSYPRFGFHLGVGIGYWPSYGYGFGYPYYAYPSYSYAYWPPYVASYPVVIEREVVRERPVDREDYDRGRAAADRYWLVAFQDKSIQAVSDYWVEGPTLHYVTREGEKRSVELSKVDLPFTKDLNRERGLEFRLPSSGGEYQPRRLDSYGRWY